MFSGVDPVTHDYIRHARPFGDMLHELFKERLPYLVRPVPDDAQIVDVTEGKHGSLVFHFEWYGTIWPK